VAWLALTGSVLLQVCCYEDSKLLKLFTDIVRMLYDSDVLAEDTINWWAKKVSSSVTGIPHMLLLMLCLDSFKHLTVLCCLRLLLCFLCSLLLCTLSQGCIHWN